MSPKTKNSEPDQSPVVAETKERRRRARKSGTMAARQKKSSEEVKKSEKNKQATSAKKAGRTRRSVRRKTNKAQLRETHSDEALSATCSSEQTQIPEIGTAETRLIGESVQNHKDDSGRVAEATRIESRQNHCQTNSEQKKDRLTEKSGNAVDEASPKLRTGESLAERNDEMKPSFKEAIVKQEVRENIGKEKNGEQASESAESLEQSKEIPSGSEAASVSEPLVGDLKKDNGALQEDETAASNSDRETSLLPELCRSVWAKAVVVLIVLALCCLLPYWWYFKRTVELPQGAAYVDVSIPSGSSGRVIANRISEAGVGVSPDTLIGLLRVQGASLGIHAGRYRFVPGVTLADIVEKLQRGEVEKFSFRVSDGQAIWDLRRAVSALPDITIKAADMTEDQLRAAIGIEEPYLEGVFAPETYSFRTGITDLDVYRAAYREQMRILAQEWENRSPDAMVKTKYEALILASIIEKETSMPDDRALISSVFNNRLRLRMPLQTDPTIIYGLGENFNGNLTRRDMQRPGPYNTYLNMGLPPTPISMPTAASIHAALNPQKTKYLYFVARGDGTTYFSKTLAEHNRAVEKYQKAPARKARAQQRQDNAR